MNPLVNGLLAAAVVFGAVRLAMAPQGPQAPALSPPVVAGR